MKTTKEEIRDTSVRLFAERGYDAVSTSMIAGELGITKGALYRHFKNKQAIFDSIVEHMFELDEERAIADQVPEKEYEEDPGAYKQTDPEAFCEFVNHQFVFWTEDPFASCFRKMLTIEQFKSGKRQELYQNVIVSGPVTYSENLLAEMITSGKLNREAEEFGARNLALTLFAPLWLMIGLSDGGEEREKLKTNLRQITEEFEHRWMRKVYYETQPSG